MTKFPKINQVFFFLLNRIYLPVIKDDKIYLVYLSGQVYNKQTFNFLFSSLFWTPIFLILSATISILFRIDYWVVLIIFAALFATPVFGTYLDIADEYFYNKFKIKLKMIDREAKGLEAIESGDDQQFYKINKKNQIVKIDELENIVLSNKLINRIWPETHFGTIKFVFKSGAKSFISKGKTILIDSDPAKFSQILSDLGIHNTLD